MLNNHFTDTFSSYLSAGMTYLDSLDDLEFNQAEARRILTKHDPVYSYITGTEYKCYSFNEDGVFCDYHINNTPFIIYYINYTIENNVLDILGFSLQRWLPPTFRAARFILSTYLPKYNAVTVSTELLFYNRKQYADFLLIASNYGLTVKILTNSGEEIDLNDYSYFRQNIRKMSSYKLKIYSAHCYDPKFVKNS